MTRDDDRAATRRLSKMTDRLARRMGVAALTRGAGEHSALSTACALHTGPTAAEQRIRIRI